MFCESPNVVEGFNFAAEIRVRFAETDTQGVVHNSNYLVWFEVARVDIWSGSRAATRACATTAMRRSSSSRR